MDGREFSVGVIKGKALPVIEIKPKDGFYDYKNKYQEGSTLETCPAELSDDKTKEVQKMAEDISIPHVKWIVVDASASFPRFDNAERLAEKMGARYFRLEDLDADQFAEGVKAAIDQ